MSLTFKPLSSLPEQHSVNYLWNHGSESDWQDALAHYYDLLNTQTKALDRYMELLNAEEVARLSPSDFYEFLHDKYFVWKYTQKNRLATTRKSLRKYVEQDRLSELADIQRRLFAAKRADAESCLRIASEIRGLGTAGASGLLSILFPKDFGTVDQFVVKSLLEVEGLPQHTVLDEMKPDFLKVTHGALLVGILREKAAQLNRTFHTDFWTPRKIDMILWSVGR